MAAKSKTATPKTPAKAAARKITDNDKTPAVDPETEKRLKANQAEDIKTKTPDDSANADGAESKDGPGDTTTLHTKVFVLGGSRVFKIDLDKYDHEGNIIATRQYMIAQGLRPVGDVRFVGSETVDEFGSLALTYEVDAVAAEDATTVETVHATALEAGNDAGAGDSADKTGVSGASS